jgi:predicted ABC-type ATPase
MEEIYKKLTKGVNKPKKHKVALFLCGAAGTGKTSTREEFLKDTKMSKTFVYLDIDEVFVLMGKRGNFTNMFDSLLKKVIEDGYSFFYDKTCRRFQEVNSLMEDVKQKGYNVKLGIVYASLEKALDRIKKRKEQPLKQEVAKDIYKEFSGIANKYMDLDEVYLYNNDSKSKLIYSKKDKNIECIHPEMNFYFDVKDYC